MNATLRMFTMPSLLKILGRIPDRSPDGRGVLMGGALHHLRDYSDWLPVADLKKNIMQHGI